MSSFTYYLKLIILFHAQIILFHDIIAETAFIICVNNFDIVDRDNISKIRNYLFVQLQF